jgi:hypothetical protein
MCVGIDGAPALFPNPNPATSVIKNQIAMVNNAEVAAQNRTKGAAEARNVQRDLLVTMMQAVAVYIQGIADQSASWDQAVSVIKTGGLAVAAIQTHTKGILEVRQGPAPGTVSLDANVAALTAGLRGKFFFNWEFTADGKTYATLPSTPNHKTTVANLAPLTSVGFRVSVTASNGIAGEWSPTVSFIVH